MLPYWTTNQFTLATGTTSTSVGSLAIRLNSIYDCISVSTYTADPTPAADTADATINKPQMMDYWSSIYRYWTVVKSEYEFRIWNESRTDEQEISIWTYHNGQQQPPLVNAGNTNNVTDQARKMHKHCHHTLLRNDFETGKSLIREGVTIKGTYYPGNISVVNSVAEDEYKETWHRTTEVPSLREVCTFIVSRSDTQRAISTSTAVTLRYELKIKYYVQWKDLVVAYQYPTQETDFAAVDNPFAIMN